MDSVWNRINFLYSIFYISISVSFISDSYENNTDNTAVFWLLHKAKSSVLHASPALGWEHTISWKWMQPGFKN